MELNAAPDTKTLPTREHMLKAGICIGSKSDIPLRWFTTLLMLVFPAAVLFVNRADSYSFWLLVLVGTWVWLRYGARPFLDRWSAALWVAFAIFFGVAVLAYLVGVQTEDGFHFLGRYLRFLFIAPVYLAFRRYPPTAKTVFIGLALGAFAGGVVSLWHFLHVHHFIRMEAATDLSIIFGDLTTTMVLCTVAGFSLMAAARCTWALPLLILCLAGGVAATLFSGTRGAWIPLFLLIPVLTTPIGGFLKRHHLIMIMMIIITVFSSFYFIVRTDTQGRIRQALNEIQDYFVALSSLKGFNTVGNFPIHCDNSEEFLNAWSKFEATNTQSAIQAVVVNDSMLDPVGICQHKYALRLYNPSSHIWGRYIFPRMASLHSEAHPSSSVLVRGRGTFVFGAKKQDQIQFDSQNYRRLILDSSVIPEYLIIYVPPGQTAWLAPLEGYYGEFSLSIVVTSVGKRFEMWRAAWYLFLRHPFLGVGTGAYQPETQRLIARGEIAPFVQSYDHPHNDYLNALASFGIVGFLLLLGIIMVPAWFFVRAAHSGERTVHALGLAGLFTVIGFAIYALTDVVFLHNMMIIWYVIYVALFFALVQTQNEKQNNGKA